MAITPMEITNGKLVIKAKDFSEIMDIKDPKTRLFSIMDKIDFLKSIKKDRPLTDQEDLEFRNLEVQQMNAWSDWKDPE